VNFPRPIASFVLLAALLGAAAPVRAGAYDDLIAAANRDDTAGVVALLQRGMDINSVDAQGNTLLMIAVRERNQPLLEYLLGNRCNVLAKNKFGDSALMLAALAGDLGAVRRLIDAQAEIDPPGWTPLLYAAYNGHADVAAYLLERGARIDRQSASGLSALMVAAKNGHLEVAELLVQRGASTSLADQNGRKAADHAAASGNTRIVELLERAGGAR
jgi:ankyrin repeat protein